MPLKARNRCIELTLGYGNEEELGVALTELTVPREEFFVTTKVLSNIKDPDRALKTSLGKLQINYVDLYLIHSPFNVDLEKAWPAMEALRDQGSTSRLVCLMGRIGKEYRVVQLQDRGY